MERPPSRARASLLFGGGKAKDINVFAWLAVIAALGLCVILLALYLLVRKRDVATHGTQAAAPAAAGLPEQRARDNNALPAPPEPAGVEAQHPAGEDNVDVGVRLRHRRRAMERRRAGVANEIALEARRGVAGQAAAAGVRHAAEDAEAARAVVEERLARKRAQEERRAERVRLDRMKVCLKYSDVARGAGDEPTRWQSSLRSTAAQYPSSFPRTSLRTIAFKSTPKQLVAYYNLNCQVEVYCGASWCCRQQSENALRLNVNAPRS